MLRKNTISTFSSLFGATAEIANELISYHLGPKYGEPVDIFSREVTHKLIEDMQNKFDKTGNGYLTDTEMRFSGKATWEARGLGDAFPGNGLIGAMDGLSEFNMENSSHLISYGTAAAIRSAVFNIMTFGEFSDGDPIREYPDLMERIIAEGRYEIRAKQHDGDKLFYAVDTYNNDKVVHVYDSYILDPSITLMQKAAASLESMGPGGSVFIPTTELFSTPRILYKYIDPVTEEVMIGQNGAYDPQADNPIQPKNYLMMDDGKGNKTIEVYTPEDVEDSNEFIEYFRDLVRDLVISKNDISGVIHVEMYAQNGNSFLGTFISGNPAERILSEMSAKSNTDYFGLSELPDGMSEVPLGEGDADFGLLIQEGTTSKDADGVLQDLTDVVTSFGEASAEFAAYVVREGSSAVAQGFKDFNLGSVLGRLFAKYGSLIVKNEIDEDAFFRDFVLECGYELLGKSFIPAGITDYDKAFGGLLETAGFADGSVLANSLKGAIFSIAAKFALDSKGMDGDDYAKAGLSVVMGTAIDHVVSHNWGIGGPMGSGTTAALVSIATSLIHNPKLDEAALRQITVTAGVAFASVAAAELIVGTLAEVSVGAGALSCATVGSVTSGAISSGLTSTFGASAGGAIFTGLSAAVVPVVGAIIGVLISQGIGLVYKGVKLYDGQYMSAEELRNATFRVEDIDGKKVMYVVDEKGVSIGPWWNKPVDVLVGGIGSDILKATDGRDTQLLGKEGSDYIEGKFGNDLLDGGLGNDFLLGADGDDVMFGGEGSDVLAGGYGNYRPAYFNLELNIFTARKFLG